MAGIVTYDTVVVQQGQCLMDVALQHYGTTDPQALIALVQDNGLDSVTAQIKAGDILKVRKEAEWKNKKTKEYFDNNKTKIATYVTTQTINLIETANKYNAIWNDPYITFTGDNLMININIVLKETLPAYTPCQLLINSNQPVSGNILFGDSGSVLNVNANTDYSFPLLSGISVYNDIWVNLNYAQWGIEYKIKLILTRT